MANLQAEFAIIGGTGVYDPGLLEDPRQVHVSTAFGDATPVVGTFHGKTVAFMSRHGHGHSIPPHRINYRANIMALKQLGVKQIFASAAVGSLRAEYEPGSLVIVDDFLDFTKSRPGTFFEDGNVVHVDMTHPYCGRLRTALMQSAETLRISVHDGGTYVCTEGPRFETPAEIKWYRSAGAAVVGMTTVPEAVLAREAEMCYATIGMVTNFAAGISQNALTHAEVVKTMAQNVHLLKQLFFRALDTVGSERPCPCGNAVGGQTSLTGTEGHAEEGGSH